MLDLIPRGGQRHAINARVVLEAGGKRYRRELRPHVGYLGSNDPRLHIGLGTATAIGWLEITWPDGTKEQRKDIPVDRVTTIKQGQAP